MSVMGRKVPGDDLSLTDPFLYFSLVAVGLAASIAMITALCGVGSRRKSSPTSTPSDSGPLSADATQPTTTADTATSPEHPGISKAGQGQLENIPETDSDEKKELPLPPSMQQPKDSHIPSNIKRATSERRLSLNMSLKMPRSRSMAKNWDHIRNHKEDHHDGRKKAKLNADESVWMKTIILGEKCVPDEEEDAVIYEGKGKRISAYHPKNSASMSHSRHFSLMDHDAFSVPPQTQKQEERINDV